MADTLAMVSSSMSLRVGEGEGKEVFRKKGVKRSTNRDQEKRSKMLVNNHQQQQQQQHQQHQHNELSTILTTYRVVVVVVVVVVEGEAATLRLADCSRNRSLLMSVTRVVAMSNKPS